MPEYSVRLHGTGCLIEVEEKKWGLFSQTVLKPVGFYTTRLIEAENSADASQPAILIVQNELREINRSVILPIISADEVTEEAEGFANYAPGSDFTWYSENTR